MVQKNRRNRKNRTNRNNRADRNKIVQIEKKRPKSENFKV